MVRKIPANSAATSPMAWKVKRFASRTSFGVARSEAAPRATRASSRPGARIEATEATTASKRTRLAVPLTRMGSISARSRATADGASRAWARRSQTQ